MRIENVLIGYDGFARDERLPEQAFVVARAHRARVRVVHVLEAAPRGVRRARGISAAELQAALAERRLRELDRLAHAAARHGGALVETTTEVRCGVPHVELIRAAVARDADLVMVYDEPQRRHGGFGFGSVTRKLLRCCPVPVWAARHRVAGRTRRVMAAVDVEDTHALNQRILDLAEQFAVAKDATLTVIHVWLLPGEHLLRGYGGLPTEKVDSLLAHHLDEAHRAVARLVADRRVAGRPPDILVVKGDARAVIPAAVRERGVDLLVMGTVARTGVAGLFVGNTAERIIEEVPCSVLTVKPAGFVSPVTTAEAPPTREDDEERAPPPQ
jgi:universal stress protein E